MVAKCKHSRRDTMTSSYLYHGFHIESERRVEPTVYNRDFVSTTMKRHCRVHIVWIERKSSAWVTITTWVPLSAFARHQFVSCHCCHDHEPRRDYKLLGRTEKDTILGKERIPCFKIKTAANNIAREIRWSISARNLRIARDCEPVASITIFERGRHGM